MNESLFTSVVKVLPCEFCNTVLSISPRPGSNPSAVFIVLVGLVIKNGETECVMLTLYLFKFVVLS